MTTLSTGADWAQHWDFEPGIAYLNHGSFGACPRPMLEAQGRYRAAMERNPMRFFLRDLEALIDHARASLADLVGARPENLVFVGNATSGANTVLRSLDLAPGDEILVANMGYPGVLRAVEYAAHRTGALVTRAMLPFPVAHEDEIVRAIEVALSPRTRLCLVDHVVSATGIVLPIERVVALVEGRGVRCLVDGAHAVGMLPLRLEELGASYYVSNCHKWLCTPKGSAFLHARSDRHEGLHPLTISHGYGATDRRRPRLWREFDWQGTHDPTAVLCIDDAIHWFAETVPGGWPAIQRRNRELTLAARTLLCDRLQAPPPCPDSMVGSLAVVPLPPGETPPADTGVLPIDPLQRELAERGMEVYIPYFPAPPTRYLRVAAALYNSMDQFERLADAVAQLAPRE